MVIISVRAIGTALDAQTGYLTGGSTGQSATGRSVRTVGRKSGSAVAGGRYLHFEVMRVLTSTSIRRASPGLLPGASAQLPSAIVRGSAGAVKIQILYFNYCATGSMENK